MILDELAKKHGIKSWQEVPKNFCFSKQDVELIFKEAKK